MKVVTLLMMFFSSFLVGEKTVPTGYQPGDKATDFKLKSVDGKQYSMSNMVQQKRLMYFFWIKILS
jgi:hypothetical protein